MSRDRGVNPGYVERAFREEDRRKRNAQGERRLALAHKRERARKLEAAASALAALPKPSKPPGNR